MNKKNKPIIVRTSRGLTIAGTRITLYAIMDYLKVEWPAKLIRDRLNLTDEQIKGALAYIESHREEVEKEYQLVLKQADEIRQYWESRNKGRFAKVAALPAKPGLEAIKAKIRARKRELNLHD
jgi:uncharacterized protein (DUF433 family)